MIVFDTNVLSELMRSKPFLQVVDWVRIQPTTSLFTTYITEAEMRYGIELLPADARKDGLQIDSAGQDSRHSIQQSW